MPTLKSHHDLRLCCQPMAGAAGVVVGATTKSLNWNMQVAAPPGWVKHSGTLGLSKAAASHG